MPTKKKDPLFKLVKSLTKPEKRHFKLYANRTMGNQERKFMVLFNLLDKQESYDEQYLLEKLPGKTTKGRLANLKRHLFKQLLTSLRLTHINKLIDIEIREQLDFARILYSKGLYMESLRLLERIKEVAAEHNQEILHLQILEFQKLIESRHITRSRQVEKKMERLLQDASRHGRTVQANSEMVNLNIQIHGYYIVHGFATTPEELRQLEVAWANMQPELPSNRFQDSFFERIYVFQSRFWHRYIQLNFKKALAHAQEGVAHFELNVQMKYKDPDLYLRTLYYLLVFQFLTDDTKAHTDTLARLDRYVQSMEEAFNLNSQHVRFVYQNLSRLNAYFLQKDYAKALTFSEHVYAGLDEHRVLMDDHRMLLFYYKFAAAAFGAQAYERALGYLHPILHQGALPLHRQMEINARLLELMCLYASNQLDRLGYRLTSFSRSVLKSEHTTPLQQATYQLLRHLLQHYATDQSDYLQTQIQHFQARAEQPRERMFLKYLDVLEWLRDLKPLGVAVV